MKCQSVKVCKRCGVSKPVDTCFYLVGGRFPRPECKLCTGISQAAYRETRKEQYAEYKRRWAKKHPYIPKAKAAKKCRDCGRVQNGDEFHGRRCIACFKTYDALRGVKARDAKRAAKGKIKPSSEVSDLRECGLCREIKPTKDGFYMNKRPDGRLIPSRRCKVCEYTRFVEVRKKRKAKYAEYQKNARLRNPEKHRAWKKAYLSSPEGIAASREYRLKNKDRMREQARARYRTEAGRIASVVSHQRRRAVEEAAITPLSYLITDKWTSELFARYDNSCVYCGSKEQMTMDHVIPLSRGGKHEPLNIVPACHLCNSVKRNKFVHDWRPWVAIPGYGLDLATA